MPCSGVGCRPRNRHCQPAGRGPAVKGGPSGPSAASRAAAPFTDGRSAATCVPNACTFSRTRKNADLQQRRGHPALRRLLSTRGNSTSADFCWLLAVLSGWISAAASIKPSVRWSLEDSQCRRTIGRRTSRRTGCFSLPNRGFAGDSWVQGPWERRLSKVESRVGFASVALDVRSTRYAALPGRRP
jgi:hypothetical protein